VAPGEKPARALPPPWIFSKARSAIRDNVFRKRPHGCGSGGLAGSTPTCENNAGKCFAAHAGGPQTRIAVARGVGDLEKRHATTLLIPFTAVIRGPYLVRIDQDEARRYLAGVRDLAAEAVASADPRVIICALRVLELAPASIRGCG
jgi:hypothetical protein